MKELRLTIVGGCLNSGYSVVPFDSLYHRIMAREIKTTCEVQVRTRLGRQFSLNPDQIVQDTIALLDQRPCEGLVVQIRPELLHTAYTALWANVSRKSRISGLKINPVLLGKSPPRSDRYEVRAIHRFHPMNRFLSRVLGLDRRATAKLVQMVKDLAEACRLRGVDLFLIGPIFGHLYPPGFQKFLHTKVMPALTKHAHGYIDPQRVDWSSPTQYFLPDGLHLTTAGHAAMARLVTDQIRPWALKRNPAQSASGIATPR